MIAASAALGAGLFPTLRAIVNGSSVQPVAVPATTQPAVGPLTAATRAQQSAAPGSLRVLLVGNSVAYDLAPAFRAITSPPTAVLDESIQGCGFPPELTDVHITLPDRLVIAQPPCDPDWEAGVVARFRPRVVFWIVSDPLGTGGTYRGQRVRPCDAAYDTLYERRLKQEVAVLGARGAHVVVVTEAYSRYLGVKKYDRGTDCQNRIRRQVATTTGAHLADLFEYVCPRGHCVVTRDGVTLRSDGLHYQGAGARIVAQWLLDQTLSKRS